MAFDDRWENLKFAYLNYCKYTYIDCYNNAKEESEEAYGEGRCRQVGRLADRWADKKIYSRF